MPTSSRESLLSGYRYDPLNRLVDCTPFKQAAIQRHYCKTRLATEIQGAVQRSIVQHDDQLLAQQQGERGKTITTLLTTDQQRSVLTALDTNQPAPLIYTPYGHRPREKNFLSLLGFNGERPDPVTGHYHLGNGYRQFNPVLMRFNSPDSWSPFGAGGLNAYAYCRGNSINTRDPSGHVLKPILRPPTLAKPFKIPRPTFQKNPGIDKNIKSDSLKTTLGQNSQHDMDNLDAITQQNTIKNASELFPENGIPKQLVTKIKETAELRYSDPTKIPNREEYYPLRIANRKEALQFHNKAHLPPSEPRERRRVKFNETRREIEPEDQAQLVRNPEPARRRPSFDPL
ncbi:RHS repeat-associated protein [Pseudomonas lini]|uniref:RHS repeat-associated core domain-containing protein n=1 Tax=Pseudomonas lini TaxID=163011 RepID=UPI002785ED14|nr:RHS repeat-associated core domain-containing protein [Pseudomonas lini]MDQ0125889.1 RHS repeat-associated protein [Pseudomonas lini]